MYVYIYICIHSRSGIFLHTYILCIYTYGYLFIRLPYSKLSRAIKHRKGKHTGWKMHMDTCIHVYVPLYLTTYVDTPIWFKSGLY